MEEGKDAIYSCCTNLLTANVSIKGLAQTIGVIVSSFGTVCYDQLLLNELEKCKK